MAVAVAEGALKEGNKLFNTGEAYVYGTGGHAGYQRFITDIAYITSELAVRVTEEGNLGGCMHCTCRISVVSFAISKAGWLLYVSIIMRVDTAESWRT